MVNIRRSFRSRRAPCSLIDVECEHSPPSITDVIQDVSNENQEAHSNASQNEVDRVPYCKTEDSLITDSLVTCLPKESNRDKRMRKRCAVHFADDVKFQEGTKKAKKKAKKCHFKSDNDEEVKVVHFHTGTLYMHRGRKPRVEFIWKR
mmetsp:Transcript_13813/g.19792  ORF Transcript_13813/g.19792 Transcript_13813/m.19792 type:complete len:148 (+) Transcript_13813:210-653(+)